MLAIVWAAVRATAFAVVGAMLGLLVAVAPAAAGPGGINCAYSSLSTDQTCGSVLSNFLGNMISQTTGVGVGEAIADAVKSAFGGGSSQPLGFTGEPVKDAPATRAINALAYGEDGLAYTGAPASNWVVWGDIRGTHWTGPTSNNFWGDQQNALFGIGYRPGSDVTFGVFGGAESASYSAAVIPGMLSSSGWTIGTYAGWQFMPNWRLDGAVAWSALDYNAIVVFDTGTYSGSRWLVTGGLTGEFHHGGLILEPSARVAASFEHHDAYTNSALVTTPAESATVGVVSFGGKASYPVMTSLGVFTPFIGLYGDYRFSNNGNMLQPETHAVTGLTARVSGGAALTLPTGAKVTVDMNFAGLGSQAYSVWSAHGQLSIPF